MADLELRPSGLPARRADRLNVLPHSLPPRGLERVQAAAYVGLSPSKFDELVKDGRMPRAKRADGKKVWDVRALDRAFDALPDDGPDDAPAPGDPWSDVRV